MMSSESEDSEIDVRPEQPGKFKLLYILNYNVEDIKDELDEFILYLENYEYFVSVADDIKSEDDLRNAFDSTSWANCEGIILLVLSSYHDNFRDKIRKSIEILSSNAELTRIPKICIFIEERNITSKPEDFDSEHFEIADKEMLAYRMIVNNARNAINQIIERLQTLDKKEHVENLFDAFPKGIGYSKLLTQSKAACLNYICGGQQFWKIFKLQRLNMFILSNIRQYMKKKAEINPDLTRLIDDNAVKQIEKELSYNLLEEISNESQKLILKVFQSMDTSQPNYITRRLMRYEIEYNTTLLFMMNHKIFNIGANTIYLQGAFINAGLLYNHLIDGMSDLDEGSYTQEFLSCDRLVFVSVAPENSLPGTELGYVERFFTKDAKVLHGKPKLLFFIYKKISDDDDKADAISSTEMISAPQADFLIVQITVKNVAEALYQLSEVLYKINSNESAIEMLQKLMRNINGTMSYMSTLTNIFCFQKHSTFKFNKFENLYRFILTKYNNNFAYLYHLPYMRLYCNLDILDTLAQTCNLSKFEIELIRRNDSFIRKIEKKLNEVIKQMSLIESKGSDVIKGNAINYSDNPTRSKLLYLINNRINLGDENIITKIKNAFENIGFTLEESGISTVKELREAIKMSNLFNCSSIAFVALANENVGLPDENLHYVEQFFADKAPSLAGCPKLFFFVYKKLSNGDDGTDHDKDETNLEVINLPCHADCLIIDMVVKDVAKALEFLTESLGNLRENALSAYELMSQIMSKIEGPPMFISTMTRRLYFKKRILTEKNFRKLLFEHSRTQVLNNIEIIEKFKGLCKYDELYSKHNLETIKSMTKNGSITRLALEEKRKIIDEILNDIKSSH